MTNSRIRILVVEDDPFIGLDIKQQIEQFGWEAHGPIASADEAKKTLAVGKFDLVLLDVELEGVEDGADIAAYINTHLSIPFIFITSYSDSLSLKRIKAQQPAAYLHKPFDKETLKANIEIALFKSKPFSGVQLDNQPVFVKSQGKMIKIEIEDILFLQAEDNYSLIHTNKGEFLLSSTLKKMESTLAKKGFVRVHRSYLVNLYHLQSVSDIYLFLPAHKIPLGKSYKSNLLEHIQVI